MSLFICPRPGLSIVRLVLLTIAAGLCQIALAADSTSLRGGWQADIDGQRHIFYIVLRNGSVSGVYCQDCENPDNLAIIDDGSSSGDSLTFTLYHTPAGQAPFRQQVRAQLVDNRLQVNFSGPAVDTRNHVFRRMSAEEKVLYPIAPYQTNRPAGNGPRQLAGPAQVLTLTDIEGLWLWGTGPAKQYFIFKTHKGGLRGMVCGPCFSVNDMAPLEQIRLDGMTLHFEIVHEDNGGGYRDHGAHSNVTEAQLSRNEMHMSVYPSYAPDSDRIEMTLLGPVAGSR